MERMDLVCYGGCWWGGFFLEQVITYAMQREIEFCLTNKLVEKSDIAVGALSFGENGSKVFQFGPQLYLFGLISHIRYPLMIL